MLTSRLVISLIALALVGEALAQTDPAPAEQTETPLEICDRKTAAPLDPNAKAPPVWFHQLFELGDPTELAKACLTALEADPSNARLRLQLARVAVTTSDPRVVPMVRELARTGSPDAQYLLMNAYHWVSRNGAGPAQGGPLISRAEGEAGLRTAAEAEHPEAMYDLGERLARGRAVRQDFAEARKWLERAAADNSPEPIRFLAQGALADALAADPNASEADKLRAFTLISQAADVNEEPGQVRLAAALRRGLGTPADPARARKILEDQAATGSRRAIAMLSEMLIAGEGGPADPARARALLGERKNQSNEVQLVLGRLLAEGTVVGRNPRRAVEMLRWAAVGAADREPLYRLVGLIGDYRVQVPNHERIKFVLEEMADVGDVRAAMALATLKMSGHEQFRDETGAYALFEMAADAGDERAILKLAERKGVFVIHGSKSFADEVKATVARLMEKNVPAAHTLHGKLLRTGGVYPQDDVEATKSLIKGAELGDLEAMLLLAKAYDDGLGVQKNRTQQLRWLRAAVRKGSNEARGQLRWLYTFDDGAMTLREGVSEMVALYNDRIGNISSMDFRTRFVTGPASKLPKARVAAAVMDGFRIAPAGLDDEQLVPLMRSLESDMKVEIEKILKAEGFYQGEPEGYFGPQVRAALAAWALAKGPLGEELEPAPSAQRQASVAPQLPPGHVGSGTITVELELYKKIYDRTVEATKSAKTTQQKTAAFKMVNLLAQFGDPTARWAIVDKYAENSLIPKVVSPAEVIRYNLDLILTKAKGHEKADINLIFNTTRLTRGGQGKAFAEAVVAAIRDDARLHQPEALANVLAQFNMAPLGCESLAREGARLGVTGIERDGCSEVSRDSLIAFAKAQGPLQVEIKARTGARDQIRKLAEAR